ncbi:CBS domain-containing protein [Desulfobacterales bacterium HSG2]|nr:CBS domain-containing protein [Desulfobacterales bacterium HSG2]
MKTVCVKDLMIPLDEYATVPKDATLYDAIIALEKALQDFDQKRYPHRAILVYEGEKENIVGKVGQLDVLKALEPKYEKMMEKGGSLARFGFGRQFKKSLLEQYKLWDKPLSDVCKKSAEIRVKEFMYAPGEGEYVEASITLDEAINQLVIGRHQSLLVTEAKKITGILRLTDVFMAVFNEIRASKA